MDSKLLFKKNKKKKLWDKHCYFLDLSLDEFMEIQKEELNNQLKLWNDSKLRHHIINNDIEITINNFREIIPLTTYYDYADILLNKDCDALPVKPELWIQTTWEGGEKPIKLAPYTREMLDTFRDNIVSCIILSTSKKRYKYTAKYNDKILYGLAPLPFLTGLVPKMLSEATNFRFLPPVDEALEMSFSQRNKLGFKMALKEGVDFFFGLGSVAYAITQTLSAQSKGKSSIKSLFKCSPKMIFRLIKSKIKSKITKKPTLPKDLFKLKALNVAGTDNKYYTEELKQMWGIKPCELFAGTEPSLIGTETWCKNGMYFIPRTCFYEFVKLEDSIKNKINPNYIPKTYLMDEVEVGCSYEIVISVFHGGAFMRYRVGDVYKCLAIGTKEENTKIPKFEYLDRVPWVIDVAGFTRFTEDEITNVLNIAQINVNDWAATKGFTDTFKPFLQLYLEINGDYDLNDICNRLDETFTKVDEDYLGLKKILGRNPLNVTIIPNGTIKAVSNSNKLYLKVDSFNNHYKKYE